MMTRIDVTPEEALALTLDTVEPLEPETVLLADALDRVLAADIRASCALPPFPNAGMDGYAVRAADIAGASHAAPVRLRVLSSVPAGSITDTAIAPGTAVRIMTG